MGGIEQAPQRDWSRRTYLGAWRVDIVRRAGGPRVLADAAIARAVAAALEAGSAPEPGSVTVVLTDDAELEELNVAHMGHEGPTDVLSFPMLEAAAFRRQASGSRRAKPSASTGPARRTHIGDIAISVERAIAQAEAGRGGQTGDVRWSAADEVRLLVTHGTLHLCGWDHATPTDEAAMRGLERRLLEPAAPLAANVQAAGPAARPQFTSGRRTRRRRPAGGPTSRRRRS